MTDAGSGTPSKSLKEESRRYSSSKEAITNKYAAIREQSRQTSFNTNPVEKNIIASTKVSLLDAANPDNTTGGSPTGLASKWESMKNGFQNFKANIAAKKFIPLRQVQETVDLSRGSSSESLDDIFQRLKRPSLDHVGYADEDEDEDDMEVKRPAR